MAEKGREILFEPETARIIPLKLFNLVLTIISNDEKLLEACCVAAEDNPFIDYAALTKWYSEGDGLTDYELLKVRQGIEDCREELRRELSDLTGISGEELEEIAESVEFDAESELEDLT